MFLRDFKKLSLFNNLRLIKLQSNVERSFIVSSAHLDPIKVQLDRDLEQKLECEEVKVS